MSYEFLSHYGTPRHSGRYPYGSGENPFQHESAFLKTIQELKSQGFSETEIASYMGISTTELRKRNSLEKAALKEARYSEAVKLKDKGYSNVAIAEYLGVNESYVRNLLKPELAERARKTEVTADILKNSVDELKYVDIGPGSENMLGVSRTKMMTAIQKLEDEGYKKQILKIEQAGIPGQYTYIQVLTAPGVDYKELYANRDKIGFPAENLNEALLRSNNGDVDISRLGLRKPVSIDSNRIEICYAEQGGKDKDGVIELRRGVPDLSLGGANYAQVRIAVDDSKYLKGMAVYSDDLPKGVDIRFNTNKSSDVSKLEVLKDMKRNKDGSVNWDNPFGATLEMKDGKIVGQKNYIDKDGKEQQSPINIVRSEGSWNTWSLTLASQFLSKQPIRLINQQLDKSYDSKLSEFKDISKLTNPEIKKMMLEQFANDCDASAAHLKAASLPRQSSKVILPLTDISDKEIYAPGYENGEEVVLIRYPHGGTFELPRLTVNNKVKSGDRTIGKHAIDAVGISSKVAERLSGADFDGDTVVVIPTRGQKIKTSDPLKGLEGFDPKDIYGTSKVTDKDGKVSYLNKDGKQIKVLTEKAKQNEMGRVSNLITDMTLKGAEANEIARAVRHSMVVIDAAKHKLDYKQSEIDNNIKELKTKYQGGPNSGASTLISKANAEARIGTRKEITNPKKMTPEEQKRYSKGEKIFRSTEEKYFNKNGVEKERLIKVPKMSLVSDANELSSGTLQEKAYADYANKLKALANEARAIERSTPNSKYSPSAKQVYAQEVLSLNSKLKVAISNKPLERKAQILADVTIKNIKKDNPEIAYDKDEIKKLKTQALAAARATTGASKSERSIQITDKEWEAIQAGALSSNRVKEILSNTDVDRVKSLATPRESKGLSSSEINRIQSLANKGYTLNEIAKDLNISTTTVYNTLNEAQS